MLVYLKLRNWKKHLATYQSVYRKTGCVNKICSIEFYNSDTRKRAITQSVHLGYLLKMHNKDIHQEYRPRLYSKDVHQERSPMMYTEDDYQRCITRISTRI